MFAQIYEEESLICPAIDKKINIIEVQRNGKGKIFPYNINC